MKALIGVDNLTDLAPSSVISEMERLGEKVLIENSVLPCGGVEGHAIGRDEGELQVEALTLKRNRNMDRPSEYQASPAGNFALTECEHGVHVDSPSPCKVCGAQ